MYGLNAKWTKRDDTSWSDKVGWKKMQRDFHPFIMSWGRRLAVGRLYVWNSSTSTSLSMKVWCFTFFWAEQAVIKDHPQKSERDPAIWCSGCLNGLLTAKLLLHQSHQHKHVRFDSIICSRGKRNWTYKTESFIVIDQITDQTVFSD